MLSILKLLLVKTSKKFYFAHHLFLSKAIEFSKKNQIFFTKFELNSQIYRAVVPTQTLSLRGPLAMY
jgi:hypothetical protein